MFDSSRFRRVLEEENIAIMGLPVKGSIIYQSYGTDIRNQLYQIAICKLKELGYKQVILSDFVSIYDLYKMDCIESISDEYLPISESNSTIAAGHEINAYLYMKYLLKHYYHSEILPIRFYNFGGVYRYSKNCRFPFNLGERKSFLECYAAFKTSDEAMKELKIAVDWNRFIIRNVLHIPSIEVIRPICTNKKISKQTICIDSITPLGETVITGMTYFHDDIFTKTFSVKYKDFKSNKNVLTYSTHFGISDNIFFSYLLNSFDGKNLRLLNAISPVNISIINCLDDKYSDIVNIYKQYMTHLKFRIEEIKVNTSNIRTVINHNILKGIAVTVLLKCDKEGCLDIHVIDVENEYKTNIEQLVNLTVEILNKNDCNIINNMKIKESDMIIDCNNMDNINQAVMGGYVARVYCENNENTVKKIEKQLFSGEILGFSFTESDGVDIINGHKVKTVAYISKRL